MLKRDDLLPYLIISVVIHAVVLFLVLYSKPKPLFISAPIDVTFYTPAQTRADPPPVEKVEEKTKPEPVKEEVKEEPKTKDDVVVKEKEKPKPQPKPKPKPKPKEPPKKEEPKKVETPPQPQSQNINTVQAPADDVRYEATGTQFEGLAFDTANFKYAYYTNTIVRKISRFWQWSDSYGRRRAVVYFKILKDGTIDVGSIIVKESSGDAGFDQNAERSVKLASPFAPLPDGYGGSSLGVYFEFKYRN